jgi:hypothetical protein
MIEQLRDIAAAAMLSLLVTIELFQESSTVMMR